MKFLIFVVFFGFLALTAYTADIKKLETEYNINEIVDKALVSLSEWSNNGHNPIPMPDTEERIKKGFIKGYLKLSQGGLYNLGNVVRDGDCIVDYKNVFTKATTTLNVHWNDLRIQYHYHAKLLISASGTVVGKAKGTSATLSLSADLIHLFKLEDFHANVDKVDLDWHDNAVVDWLLEIISGVVIPFFKGKLTNLLNNELRSALESVVQELNNKIRNKGLGIPPAEEVSKFVVEGLAKRNLGFQNININFV